MASTVDTLDRVRELYEQGLYLQALEAGEQLGPLRMWPHTAGRVLAGRLANRLGAPRLGALLHYLAWRASSHDLNARCLLARVKLQRGRLLAAWRLLQEQAETSDAAPADLAHWRLLHAEVLALFRDFPRAEDWFQEAEALTPHDPWLWCVRSRVLAAQDRYDEALAAAQQALSLRPWYVPAVQATAHGLMQFNRDDEALELLAEASRVVECGAIFMQLAALHSELGAHQQALACYRETDRYYPLSEPSLTQALAARRSDAAYRCQDFEQAATEAVIAGTPFHLAILPRLIAHQQPQRTVLPVKFVQQHHVTCVPATLAAISDFWSLPADHLEISAAICYDGTPTHSERRWAMLNGFAVREFRVTWETAVALLDRGVPWLLTTAGPGMGHVQAAVGYDTLRETLITRDPSCRELSELLVAGLCGPDGSRGPRGMVMVPAERDELLEDIALPDCELYDRCFDLQCALERHDRYRAQEIIEDLRTRAPDHALTLQAQSMLCRYDADPIGLLSAIEQELAQSPGDFNLVMAKLGCLNELGRRQDRLAMLYEILSRGAPHPLFMLMYAQEQSGDARCDDEVIYILRRVLRYAPLSDGALSLLAQKLWQRQRREEALVFYRFTACLSDRQEQTAQTYFQAARHLGRTAEALQFLQERFDRYARQSSAPTRTLCAAYAELAQATEAFEVLEAGRKLRPDDPELTVYAAHMYAVHGDAGRARELLINARNVTRKSRWLREAAYLAALDNAPAAALARWQEVLELEPLAADAHHAVASLLVDSAGSQAALGHLRTACSSYPLSYALRSLLLEWVKLEGPEAVEQVARDLLEFQPLATHARCDLVQALLFQQRVGEAWAEAELARQLEPSDPRVFTMWGILQRTVGDRAAAKQAFQAAIRLSADDSNTIGGLLSTTESPEQAREELLAIYEAFVRQTIFGDGLLVFRHHAQGLLEPLVVLEVLREAHHERPDLWHAWSAIVRQLIEMGQADEALATARRAVDRFPLLPRLWADLGLACKAAGQRAEQIAALQRALQLDPTLSEAVRELAEVAREAGELEQAQAGLQEAAVRLPRDAAIQRDLAEILLLTGDEPAARERLAKAVRLDPSDDKSWQLTTDLARRISEPEFLLEAARELRPAVGIEFAQQLARDQPDESRWHVEQAGFLVQLGQLDEALAAVGQAVQLDPRDPTPHDRLAEYLTLAGRYDEALAACRPAALGDSLPSVLQARAANVLWHRGDYPQAMERMEQVVREAPDLLCGWTCLAEWLTGMPEHPLYLLAAENWTRLAPEDAVGWGHLGFALSTRSRSDRAKHAYRRAIEIAPRYLFAGMSLLDLYLDEANLAEAAEVLSLVKPYLRYVDAVAAEGRLDVARGEQAAAEKHLRQLCRFESVDPDAVAVLVGGMASAGWGPEALELISGEVESGQGTPLAAQLWIDLVAADQGWRKCEQKLRQWVERPDAWYAASWRYLDILVGANARRRLRRFVAEHRGRLAAHLHCWAQVGAAYCKFEWHAKTAKWMADWQGREGCEPQMLHLLAISLLTLKRDAEAAGVCRAALALPADESSVRHAAWVVFDDALAGNLEPAIALRQRIDPRAMGDNLFYQALLAMADALVADASPVSGPAQRSGSVLLAGRLLQKVRRGHSAVDQSPLLRRQYFRAQLAVARRSRSRLRGWWYWWRLLLA
jgi:tetratricopeptide (TPR) repeat protein